MESSLLSRQAKLPDTRNFRQLMEMKTHSIGGNSMRMIFLSCRSMPDDIWPFQQAVLQLRDFLAKHDK